MRLFVGMTPSSEAISHAAGAVDRIPSTTPDLRWIPPQRWHVTLAFLGEVDSDRVPALAAQLDEVAAHHAPLARVRLEGAGTFRGVLWLGVTPTEPHSAADRLARGVQHSMREAHIAVDRRPWRAHLTIARWRPSPARDEVAHDAAEALAEYSSPEFGVHEIRLVHSITGPSPRYADLHVVALGQVTP